MDRKGFTLIELLVVVAIIAILATLGSRIIRSSRIAALKAQAGIEMQSIETAVRSYQNKFGRLPLDADRQGRPEQAADEAFSRGVLRMLAGDNPASMPFLELPAAGGNESDGTFLDPWGRQYRVFLDTDYDGAVGVSVNGLNETVRRKVAVVAVGLYERNGSSNTNDLVASWR